MSQVFFIFFYLSGYIRENFECTAESENKEIKFTWLNSYLQMTWPVATQI